MSDTKNTNVDKDSANIDKDNASVDKDNGVDLDKATNNDDTLPPVMVVSVSDTDSWPLIEQALMENYPATTLVNVIATSDMVPGWSVSEDDDYYIFVPEPNTDNKPPVKVSKTSPDPSSVAIYSDKTTHINCHKDSMVQEVKAWFKKHF